MKRAIVLLIFAAVAATSAWAQFELGSVVGVVKDQSGSVIANATVEIKSLATNVVRQVTSSSSGEFDFVALQPGRYSITARQTGFKEATQDFELTVGQRLQLSLEMQIGTATQSVTVSANTETIETASSDIGNLRTQQQVVDLPLNSRNFTQLVQLAPGVNNRGNSSNSIQQGYTSGRGTNGAVVNGNPSEDTTYLFDGIQSVDNDAGILIFFPPVDTIQEFKVQTSAAPAAYGGGPSIINVTFRSGTNNFHGTFYEFLRNSAFDAKNYFDSPTKPIVPFHMNQFGANVGGPVILPHLFNGKDRLFFFADYEGKRVSQAQTYISTVPTALMHTGNFSELMPASGCTAGKKTTGCIYYPGTLTPVPGNQVSSIDPTSAKLMTLFPLPNRPGFTTVSNYLYNGAVINDINQGDLRMDYRTARSSIFGRFSKENPDTITPGYLPAPAIGGGPSRPGQTPVPAWQGVLGYGLSIGSNKYYEARLGYSRVHELIIDQDTNQGNMGEKYGIPNANAGGAPGMTNFSISGNVGLGDGAGTLEKINNNWEFDQALSWVRGSHEVKFGFGWMSRRFAFFSPTWPVGTFAFNGAYTGYGLADFLYGRPSSSEIDITKFFSLLRFQPSFYVQDNWRVTPNLTLNIGLRNDLVTPWGERHNRLAGFVPTNGGNLVPVGTAPFTGNTVTVGRYTNWAPRFGFAYSLNAKTVIRGGAGIFYAFENDTSNVSEAKNAPFSGSFTTANNTTSAAGYAAALPISAGFPAQRPDLYPVTGSTFVLYPRAYQNPSANEWNLNVQRQLTSHDVLSVAYVGQTGVHVITTPNINQAIPGPGAVVNRRPYPNLADGTAICPCGNSVFNSLQVSYENRISGGLDFQGAWTYSHSIDNSSGVGNTVAMQNPYNLSTFRGSSDFDVRHNVVLSWSYDLPFGQGKKFLNDAPRLLQTVVGGWQLNSIDTFQTGAPFTPVMVSSQLNAGSAVQWPNRIGSGKLSNPSPKAWFDTKAFVSPGQYQYGNSGRNILYGPGTKQFDASLFKNIAFNEAGSRYLQFRAEAFNVFNTPQFNNPNAQIGNPIAGTITSAGAPLLFARTSREIQLAMKLYW
ncbi:MAG TPA: carboxypeptidase regulatory-like domain-containing protein [Acidobacteriaceae bacterium]|nr:carboxypeptidase regulatory-like domain-containing protein [Acidobacteriaceae bacterium]